MTNQAARTHTEMGNRLQLFTLSKEWAKRDAYLTAVLSQGVFGYWPAEIRRGQGRLEGRTNDGFHLTTTNFPMKSSKRSSSDWTTYR
jgi:hypothetical protein